MTGTESSAWATFRLARNDEAPARARAQLRGLLTTVPTAIRSDALMLLSEMVTNAVRHGSGVITVSAEADDAGIDVSVADEAAAEPRLMIQPLEAEGGRGLALVATLADAWGVRQLPDGRGKAVWFRIGAPRPQMRSGEDVGAQSDDVGVPRHGADDRVGRAPALPDEAGVDLEAGSGRRVGEP